MNFACQRPWAFFALLLIIPAAIFKIRQFRNLNYKKRLITRAVFHTLSFCSLIFAYSGLFWGSHLVPVQKYGSAVSFVFDISNSMKANDGPENISRMQASAEYAGKLISKMEGTTISVVLAKGDGIVAIPLTEDYVIIESLLESLSPSLMTAPGSSLGKGILCAKDTFSKNFSAAGRIWLFTDGEETDNSLKAALEECIKTGIPVTIIGFGSEKESGALAGDGKTVVQTALRKDKIEKIISQIETHFSSYKTHPELTFVDSSEKGSLNTLLSQINRSSYIAYEAKPVPHYKMFLILALLFFALSFISTELNIDLIKKQGKQALHAGLLSCIFILPLFTGCTKATILKGVYSYNQGQYQHSVSLFMEATSSAAESDSQTKNYCLYDLGTAYLMLDEENAAMEKYASITDDANSTIKYRAYYNAGIIAHNNADYEKAAEFFRKALEADNSKIEAKINLELSIKEQEVQVNTNQNQSTPASETKNKNSDLEKAVFRRIKENEKKQWKNSGQSQEKDLSDDF